MGSKTRMAESAGPEPAQLHDSPSFAQVSRGPVSVAQLDQSALNYSGGQEEKRLKKASAVPQPHPVPCSLHARTPQIHTSHLLPVILSNPGNCVSDLSSSGWKSYCSISLKNLKYDKILRYVTVRVYANICQTSGFLFKLLCIFKA